MVASLYPKCGADLGLSFIFEANLAIGRGPRDMDFHDLYLPLNNSGSDSSFRMYRNLQDKN